MFIEIFRKYFIETFLEQKEMRQKLPKYCTTCKTELRFDNSSYSSINEHTQIYLTCKKFEGNILFCFDENMNECDKLPWEH